MNRKFLFIFAIILVITKYGDAGVLSGSRSSYSRNSSMKSPRTDSNFQKPGGSIIDNSNNYNGADQKMKQLKNIGARGSGVSAWGIISIVIAAILLATSGYYAFVFYPFLCKKERNYDMIELTNVV